jgi:hypothetical protein
MKLATVWFTIKREYVTSVRKNYFITKNKFILVFLLYFLSLLQSLNEYVFIISYEGYNDQVVFPSVWLMLILFVPNLFFLLLMHELGFYIILVSIRLLI